jgi:hypothetical protein
MKNSWNENPNSGNML